MGDQSFPGRIHFVSHAVRDIGNGLPEIVSGVKVGRLDYKTVVDGLVVTWRAHNLSLTLDKHPAGQDLPTGTPPETTSLPTPVYDALRKFLSEHAESRVRPSESAQRMFDTLLPEGAEQRASMTPVVNQWVQVVKWFVSRTHLPRSADSKGRPDEELERNFELFETTLMALVRAFFATTGDLDAILEDANS
jgi:hypothetical protein